MSATIIVAATPSEAAADAIAFAADLARVRDARLILAGVAVVPVMAEREIYAAAQRGMLERELALLLETSDTPDGTVVAVVTSTSVSRGLHGLVEREEADLLVLGPSHRGPIQRTFLGDPTLATLHGSPCPVAVASRRYAERARDAALRVGVAIGAGEETGEVLETAIELARQLGSGLTIAHVADTLRGGALPPWMDAQSSARYVRAVREHAQVVLERADETVAGRVATRTVLLQGTPGAALADLADDLDLLVMGSRAHGGIGRVLVGSTAGAVLHATGSAVLLVPQTAVRAVTPAH